jgi:hypothetical protein
MMVRPKVEGVPEYVRQNPRELEHFVATRSEDDITDLVLNGQLALEALPDATLRERVSQSYQAQQQELMDEMNWRLARELEEEIGTTEDA